MQGVLTGITGLTLISFVKRLVDLRSLGKPIDSNPLKLEIDSVAKATEFKMMLYRNSPFVDKTVALLNFSRRRA